MYIGFVVFVVKNSNNYGNKKEATTKNEMTEKNFFFCICFVLYWFGCRFGLHGLAVGFSFLIQRTLPLFSYRLASFLFSFARRFPLYISCFDRSLALFVFLSVFFSLRADRNAHGTSHYRTRYEMRLTVCGCRSQLIVCATFEHHSFSLSRKSMTFHTHTHTLHYVA